MITLAVGGAGYAISAEFRICPWQICGVGLRLNAIGLLKVTSAAKELNVRIGIAAPLCDRNDVVELQVIDSVALSASPSELLPNTLTDVARNTP